MGKQAFSKVVFTQKEQMNRGLLLNVGVIQSVLSVVHILKLRTHFVVLSKITLKTCSGCGPGSTSHPAVTNL